MSWHFSRALVEAYSADTSSDGARSALSSGNPIPQLFLPKDRMTAFSRLSRFGMTFAPLTDDLGEELLTWFRAGFHARTSAPLAEVQDLTESDQGYGAKWHASLAKYDPDTRSWKTAQFSLLGDLEPFSETWPRWGMTVGGEFYPLPTPERRTSEKESGLWPTASTRGINGGSNSRNAAKERGMWPSAKTRGLLGGSGSREMVQTLVEAGKLSESEAATMLGVKLWPTPLSTDATHGDPNQRDSSGRPGLSGMVHNWPTPKANDAEKRGDFDETNPRNGLPAAVKAGGMRTPPTYPTPTKSDGSGGPGISGRQGGENLRTNIGGQLNPEWVEWLMGWPLGWTDLKPLETARFRRWLDSHGRR